MTNFLSQTLDGINPGLMEFCDGYGCVPAKFMFVGISAGRLGALISKVPFTKDASGRIFQRCLNRLGLSKSDEFSLKPELVDCYITNLVKGRCLTDEGLNRLPTSEEIDYWIPHLVGEIKRVQPKLILALGGLVYDAFVLKMNNVSTLGEIGYPFKVVFLNHPRAYQARGALAKDSMSFRRMVSDYRRMINPV